MNKAIRFLEKINKGEFDNRTRNPISDESTDEYVFQLISVDPIYLREPFVIEKIREWQSIKAQKNLRRIGTTLAREKKNPYSNLDLIMKRHEVYKKLKEIKLLKLSGRGNKRITLKNYFVENLVNNLDDTDFRTYKDLANAITAKQTKYSKNTVERYCKQNDGYIKLLKNCFKPDKSA